MSKQVLDENFSEENIKFAKLECLIFFVKKIVKLKEDLHCIAKM